MLTHYICTLKKTIRNKITILISILWNKGTALVHPFMKYPSIGSVFDYLLSWLIYKLQTEKYNIFKEINIYTEQALLSVYFASIEMFHMLYQKAKEIKKKSRNHREEQPIKFFYHLILSSRRQKPPQSSARIDKLCGK